MSAFGSLEPPGAISRPPSAGAQGPWAGPSSLPEQAQVFSSLDSKAHPAAPSPHPGLPGGVRAPGTGRKGRAVTPAGASQGLRGPGGLQRPLPAGPGPGAHCASEPQPPAGQAAPSPTHAFRALPHVRAAPRGPGPRAAAVRPGLQAGLRDGPGQGLCTPHSESRAPIWRSPFRLPPVAQMVQERVPL